MERSDLYSYYCQLEEEEVILSYKGEITQEILTAIWHIIEGKLTTTKVEFSLKKRILNVAIESLQNLYHHVERPEGELAFTTFWHPIFIVSRYNSADFKILTGNYVPNQAVDKIKKKIDEVNNLNKRELKELHVNNLENNSFSKKGTAGLGLIDIARKSRNKINYDFTPTDLEEYSFFCFSTVVK